MKLGALSSAILRRHLAAPGTLIVVLTGFAACSPAGSRPESATDAEGTAADDAHPRPELLNRVTNAYPAWSPDGVGHQCGAGGGPGDDGLSGAAPETRLRGSRSRRLNVIPARGARTSPAGRPPDTRRRDGLRRMT